MGGIMTVIYLTNSCLMDCLTLLKSKIGPLKHQDIDKKRYK